MLSQIRRSLFSTKKTTMFKELLTNGQTNFIMEAHNGLSSKIVEEAGF
jgi:phosphoenolpyruvate phosphomutase